MKGEDADRAWLVDMLECIDKALEYTGGRTLDGRTYDAFPTPTARWAGEIGVPVEA